MHVRELHSLKLQSESENIAWVKRDILLLISKHSFLEQDLLITEYSDVCQQRMDRYNYQNGRLDVAIPHNKCQCNLPLLKYRPRVEIPSIQLFHRILTIFVYLEVMLNLTPRS